MNLPLLLFSLFSLIHAAPFPLLCNTSKFPNSSKHKQSLANLLSLYSNVTGVVPKFLNYSVGKDDSDTVYGLFWCFEYSADNDCLNCLQGVLKGIQKACMDKSEALVGEEYCLLRYSTQNFFGQLSVTENLPIKNQKNITEPDKLRNLLNNTLLNLTKLAAFDPSFHRHAKQKMPFMPNKPVYAFVECTPDLSSRDCNACLEYATKELLEKYYFAKGVRLHCRSCFLRYEFYEFYKRETGSNVFPESQNTVPRMQETRKSLQKWMISVIALGSGILSLLAVGGYVYFFVLRKRKRIASERTSNNLDMQMLDEDEADGLKKLDRKEFPFVEMRIIEQATDGFSDQNKLGEGGFGPVFKGTLMDGQEIAVKKLSSNSEQGSSEFINEVLLIHKLQHVNLVRLFGFAVKGEEKMLIYEYLPNGSLDSILYDASKRAKLDWSTRLTIINGVSRGMLYLHQDSRLKIIHRDLKPSNVLLDADMNPKISDFGIARIFGSTDGEANTAKTVGTRGYMAPEFAMEGVYSIKSDVFSFGVLLLEIITGRQNAGFHLTKLAPSLLAYAWKLWEEGRGHELMDTSVGNACPEEGFMRCLHIGLLCVQEDTNDRPSMAMVVVMLNGENVTLAQPQHPAFNVGKFDDHYATCIGGVSASGMTMSAMLPR